VAATTIGPDIEPAVTGGNAGRKPRLSPAVAIAFVLLVAFYASISGRSINYGYRHDFLNFFTGGSFARDGQFHQLYDVASQQARQHEIQPDNPVFTWFMRPPFGALLFAPLASMPYDTAFRVFLASQYAGLAVFIGWAFRRFGQQALLWCAISPVAMFAIGEGQDSVVLLLLALGAFLLLERKRDFASGILAGLMLLKFHLFLLLPLAMLVQRRWRMLAGYTAAAALQGVVALVTLGGARGILQYVNFLRTMQKSDPHPLQQISVFGLALNFHLGLAGIVAGILLVTALVVYIARRGADWQWFGAAMVGSMAVPPHVWEYDATVLFLPAMFGIFATRDWGVRIPAMLIVCPFIYMSKIAGPPFTAADSITLILFVVGLAACVRRERRADSQRPVSLQPAPVPVD
jgi:glycosyl transferase family 87